MDESTMDFAAKTQFVIVTDLRDNVLNYARQHDVAVLPVFLSQGSFTEEAQAFCVDHGSGMAEEINYDAQRIPLSAKKK